MTFDIWFTSDITLPYPSEMDLFRWEIHLEMKHFNTVDIMNIGLNYTLQIDLGSLYVCFSEFIVTF